MSRRPALVRFILVFLLLGATRSVCQTITSLDPTSQVAGAGSGFPIAISGSNFGSSQGASTVKFNGVTAAVNSWSDTSISANVPATATSGNVVVSVAGIQSNGISFTVLPSISNPLVPASGPVGSVVLVQGAGFGSSQGTGGVTLNNQPLTVNSWRTNTISVTLPSGASTGSVVVTTTAGLTSTSPAPFTVVPLPSISGVSPTLGAAGSSITISGSNFGPNTNNRSVKFGGKPAVINSWGDSSISVNVPSGASTGNIVVTTAGSVASNGVLFTIPPTITDLSPSAGEIGSYIFIGGSSLGTDIGSVSFNGVNASLVPSWTPTGIVVPVPTGATTGNLVVTSAGGTASNPLLFTVASPPVISFLTQPAGRPGMGLTIIGSNFGGSQNGGTVTFNGLPAVVGSWSDGSINTTVPAGVHTGPVVVTTLGGPSNGVQFIFAPGIRTQAQPLYITPDEISLEVGGSGAFKVVNASGNPVLDATWTVDSADLATIAADDPTLPTATLQALAPGEVTITATSSLGTAQTKATIFGAGLMPDGTASWGFYPETQDNFFDFKIRARRNNESDPYLYLPEGTNDFTHLSAISENGQLMWRITLNPVDPSHTFSFPVGAAGTNDGGVLIHSEEGGDFDDFTAIRRFGPDGTPLWTYRGTSDFFSEPAIGPDGTIYVMDLPTLIAIDDTTGTEKFRFVPGGGGTWSFSSSEQPGPVNPDGSAVTPTNPWKPCADFFAPGSFSPPRPTPGNAVSFDYVIGTDGSPYLMSNVASSSFNYDRCQIVKVGNDPVTNAPVYIVTAISGQLQYNGSAQLIRVNSSGGSTTTQVGSVSFSGQASIGFDGTHNWIFNNGASQLPSIDFDRLVPDADGGILMTWTQQSSSLGAAPQGQLTKVLNGAPVATFSITATGQMATNDQGTVFFYQKGNFSPVGDSVTAFDILNGVPKWTIAGTLLAATDDGGVLIQTGFLVVHADANGVFDPDTLPVGGTASYMATGAFQVTGLGGSVTAVSTNQTKLNQLAAVPWPLPKFANPQHTFKAKGDKTSEFVESGETSGCTGYDDQRVDLAGVMAPADGTNPSTGQVVTATGNSFNFRAPKNTDVKLTTTNGNALTLSVDDPLHPTQLIVTVPGDGVSHQVTLLGHGTAVSPVQVLMSDANTGANLGSVVQGIVLPYRFWQIHKFAIADASNNTTSGNTPAAADIATQLNRAFKTQANIEFGVLDRGLVDAFHWDTNGDHQMHFPTDWNLPGNNEAGPLNNYITTIFDGATSPLLTQGWTMYLYYVRNFDNTTTEGFTVKGKASRSTPSIVKTTYDLQINILEFMSNLTAHEFGHKLGLIDRTAQGQQEHFYLMNGFQPGNLLFKGQNTPCKLGVEEWKIANQP